MFDQMATTELQTLSELPMMFRPTVCRSRRDHRQLSVDARHVLYPFFDWHVTYISLWNPSVCKKEGQISISPISVSSAAVFEHNKRRISGRVQCASFFSGFFSGLCIREERSVPLFVHLAFSGTRHVKKEELHQWEYLVT